MTYLILKSLHLISVVCWFAGLFYLPRLFVYATQAQSQESKELLLTMQTKLYRYIMNPSVAVVFILGFSLMFYNISAYKGSGWLHIKILLVFILLAYHIICGRHIKKFKNNTNTKSEKYFRIFNEFPVVILILVMILAVIKPF